MLDCHLFFELSPLCADVIGELLDLLLILMEGDRCSVERGLIGLDDDVSGHLPELAKQPIISAAEDGSLSLEPPNKAITLRHPLTHTMGFAYDGQNPLLVRWRKETQGLSPQWKCGDFLQAYATPRLFEAVQVGRQYMEENVFRPVRATDSTFHTHERPDLEGRRLQMVTRKPGGGFEPATSAWTYPEDAPVDCGSLGLFSTVPDLIKVMGDLASKKPVLLKPETVDIKFTPQFESDDGVKKGLVDMQFMYQNLIGEGPLAEDGAIKVAFGIGGAVTLRDTVNLPKNTLTWGGMPHLAWLANRDLGVAGILASQLVPPADEKSNTMIATFLQEIVRLAKERASNA
ncbi:hypothetical protein NM208_g3737 [Fusarium decemcellulare]|uniref:Uncharacterized protein n=2 Tax=Fusarium decemcellulare TaxID=57161 RepID=A0ACC1SN93_9HYPO|nr:hypothetical protein NM208_g4846 [Fusarium decemcellulare]KAJ3543140.1 hypothetical protein NM208_g3737 [Fusarium decemcellulare]